MLHSFAFQAHRLWNRRFILQTDNGDNLPPNDFYSLHILPQSVTVWPVDKDFELLNWLYCACVVSGKQGQCVYQGLTMFDQAVWSPKPCVTCLCTGGRVVCDEITCPIMHCHFPFTPAGECCPVCMEPGRNTTCGNAMVQHREAIDEQCVWQSGPIFEGFH